MNVPNIENITYHHICRNAHLFNKVNKSIFDNPYVGLIFDFTRKFYNNYSSLPFELNAADPIQIWEYGNDKSNYDEIMRLDPMRKYEENVEDFRVTANAVIKFDVTGYNGDWFTRVAEANIAWKTFQYGLQKVVDYQAETKVNEKNVIGVIEKARSLFQNFSSIEMDEIDSMDFYNPDDHKVPETSQICPTSHTVLNKFLNGGFQLGTTTLLWGGTNVGKSIWLGNIGLDLSLGGFNVYVASLEMAAYKIGIRLAANLHDLPIDLYKKKMEQGDHQFISDKFNEFEKRRSASNFEMTSFEDDAFGAVPHGQLIIERFPEATMNDIEVRAKRKAEELGIQWHAIVIDYLGEMSSDEGYSLKEMYSLHKSNVGKIFASGARNHWAMLTAHQLKASEAAVDDLDLSSASESSGITFRPDNVLGIIQTPTMKTGNEYYLKALKTRDNPYKNYKTRFLIDYDKMRLSSTSEMYEPTDVI